MIVQFVVVKCYVVVVRRRCWVCWSVLPAGHLPSYGNLLLQTVRAFRFWTRKAGPKNPL